MKRSKCGWLWKNSAGCLGRGTYFPLRVWGMQAGVRGFLGAGGHMGFLRLSHPHPSSLSRSLVWGGAGCYLLQIMKRLSAFLLGKEENDLKLSPGWHALSPFLPVCVLVAQSYPSLCDPMDRSPPGSSVHGILQARILEWDAMPSSRGSSQPKDGTWVSRTADIFFTEPLGKPPFLPAFLKPAHP